jgi:hypothetical protein
MAIKDVVVQVDGCSRATAARFAAAIDLAQTNGAHLTGFAYAETPLDMSGRSNSTRTGA